MALSAELIAEINTLLLYNVTNHLEGIKVHKDAEQSRIDAARRLHEKGLVTHLDGGYLTDLGREASEHLHVAHSILATA